MRENYTFDRNVKDFCIYNESDMDIEKIQKVQYFLEVCFTHDYFREDSTTGLPLDEIEDILVDAEEVVKLYDAVKAADSKVRLYLEETEERYALGELAFALPKTESVLRMVEDIASKLVERTDNLFQYLEQPYSIFEIRNGIKAFWDTYE